MRKIAPKPTPEWNPIITGVFSLQERKIAPKKDQHQNPDELQPQPHNKLNELVQNDGQKEKEAVQQENKSEVASSNKNASSKDKLQVQSKEGKTTTTSASSTRPSRPYVDRTRVLKIGVQSMKSTNTTSPAASTRPSRSQVDRTPVIKIGVQSTTSKSTTTSALPTQSSRSQVDRTRVIKIGEQSTTSKSTSTSAPSTQSSRSQVDRTRVIKLGEQATTSKSTTPLPPTTQSPQVNQAAGNREQPKFFKHTHDPSKEPINIAPAPILPTVVTQLPIQIFNFNHFPPITFPINTLAATTSNTTSSNNQIIVNDKDSEKSCAGSKSTSQAQEILLKIQNQNQDKENLNACCLEGDDQIQIQCLKCSVIYTSLKKFHDHLKSNNNNINSKSYHLQQHNSSPLQTVHIIPSSLPFLFNPSPYPIPNPAFVNSGDHSYTSLVGSSSLVGDVFNKKQADNIPAANSAQTSQNQIQIQQIVQRLNLNGVTTKTNVVKSTEISSSNSQSKEKVRVETAIGAEVELESELEANTNSDKNTTNGIQVASPSSPDWYDSSMLDAQNDFSQVEDSDMDVEEVHKNATTGNSDDDFHHKSKRSKKSKRRLAPEARIKNLVNTPTWTDLNLRNFTFNCLSCDKKFASKNELQRHARKTSHKPEDLNSYRCLICSPNQDQTQGHTSQPQHLKTKEGDENSNTSQNSDRILNSEDNQNKKDEESSNFINNKTKTDDSKNLDENSSSSSDEDENEDVNEYKDLIERKKKRLIEDSNKNNETTSFSSSIVSFRKKSELRAHYKQVHPDKKFFNCNICSGYFWRSQDLRRHIREIHQILEEFQCSQCPDKPVFSKLPEFRAHLKRHEDDEKSKLPPKPKRPKLESCPICSSASPPIEVVLRKKSELISHYLTVHPGQKRFKCTYSDCDRQFWDRHGHEQHLLNHEGPASFPFGCEHPGCGLRFVALYKLRTHQIDHMDNPKLHHCPYCPAAFKIKKTLSAHIKSHERTFQCEHCGKQFNARQNLERHVKTHLGIFPFPCSYCDRRFIQKVSLFNHISHHHPQIVRNPGEALEEEEGSHDKALNNDDNNIPQAPLTTPLIRCTTSADCSQLFESEAALEKHIRKVHDTSTGKKKMFMEKRFKCSDPKCTKVFTTLPRLKSHENTPMSHSYILKYRQDVSCSHCGKEYNDTRSLAQHVKMAHVKGLNFLCQLCGRSFPSNVHFNSHMRWHRDKTGGISRYKKKKKLDPSSTSPIKRRRRRSYRIPGVKRTYNLTNQHIIVNGFKCTTEGCNRVFNSQRGLTRHFKTHIRDSLFRCSFPQCKSAFTNQFRLTRHEESHFPEGQDQQNLQEPENQQQQQLPGEEKERERLDSENEEEDDSLEEYEDEETKSEEEAEESNEVVESKNGEDKDEDEQVVFAYLDN